MTEESELITIDPNGDMLIILKDPNTALLEWKEDKELLKEMIAQAAAEATETANNSEVAPLERELPKTRYLVSSRQMRIVSPYSQNMFKFSYGETVPVFEDDLHHVQAQGWNPEAFAVVLNVAHIQLQAIPKKVSLASFAWLYVIADCYQIEGVLGLFTLGWLKQLKQQPMPRAYSKELVLWMFLSMKLQDMKTFDNMALIATRNSCYPIQFLDLPFSLGAQVYKLDGMRCAAIEKLLGGVHELIGELYQGNKGCSDACSGMLLGSLQRGLWKTKLLDVVSEHHQRPFEGIGFDSLLGEMKKIGTPSDGNPFDCCLLGKILSAICRDAEACLKLDMKHCKILRARELIRHGSWNGLS
ncbi:unnamed protein product [Alternaria alternata]